MKPFSLSELSIQVMNALRRRERLEQTVAMRTAELSRAVEDLQRSGEETALRPAAAVEARDHETAAHIERVSASSALVAKRLGLADERCELIRRASSLHDIGMIGVADGILLKPGPLTTNERAAMQRHAAIGHDILAGSGHELLELAATIAWTHHERVDGTGYPRGLVAEEIPLEGRIVAVVDVYDALTTDRPYRGALPVDHALELVRDGRGRQFDPDVLGAFLDTLARTPREVLV